MASLMLTNSSWTLVCLLSFKSNLNTLTLCMAMLSST